MPPLQDELGQISTALYLQLLAFFYCFVPMVVRAPYKDPVIATWNELEMYQEIMTIFRPENNLVPKRGEHKSHRWYSRPEKNVWTSLKGKALDVLLKRIV